jgi:hypothetical protein
LSTTEGAVLGLLVLSAGGALPALALARLRLVTIPLVPLCGALIASLAVTGMAGIGGTVGEWYIALSVLGAAAVALMWWRYPSLRPWGVGAENGEPIRWMYLAAGLGGLAVSVICLSVLKSQSTGFDTRSIWLMHPIWYLQGHTKTVVTLRNAAYDFGHPPYPPLVGGTVALTWLVAGVKSYRLGVVMIALLNALVIFAAGTAMVELGSRLALRTSDASERSRARLIGAVAMIGLMIMAFGLSSNIIANGYADALWAAAAVGAVAYGLVLPISAPSYGTALALASGAGLTKLEGTLVAVAIVGLMGARYFLARRSEGIVRTLVRAGAFVGSTFAVIGVWPVVVRLLNAHPDVAFGGPRVGTDGSRLTAAVHVAIQTTGNTFDLIVVGIVIAVVGALYLRGRRRSVGLGSDFWAWIVIGIELVVILAAYASGPGDVTSWVRITIRRTSLFPLLATAWIVGTWMMLALCGGSVEDSTGQSVESPGVDAAEAIPA